MPRVNKWMIDPDDAVMLLIDHQSGLFQLVRDIDLPVLRSQCDRAGEGRAAGQDSDLHDGLGPRWAEWTADSRDSRA